MKMMPSPHQTTTIKSPKLVDHLKYLVSNISSTESNVNKRIWRVWTTIDRLSTIRKCDVPDKRKWEYFQLVAVSVLLDG